MLARKNWAVAALLVTLAAFLVVLPAAAQSQTLRLTMGREWGYSRGSDIQGSFRLTATSPQSLTSVTFLIDGQPLATANAAPFQAALHTGDYALGQHTLSATAQTADGTTLRSNDLNVNMLSGAQAGQSILPLVAVLLAVAALGTVGSAWLSARSTRSRAPGDARNYGAAGGAICPKCGRPFALSMLSPNLVTGKLACCPYCGKWSIARRATPAALAAAEAADAAGARPAVPEMSAEEKLRRQIEDARFR